MDSLIDIVEIFSADYYALMFQPKKKKNITHDAFGTKEGRIHMEKQDLSKLQLRKIKGLKRTSSEATKSPSKKKLKASDET